MAGGIATIGTLLGKVNSANALVVTLSGGSAVATTFVGPAADNTGAVPFTFTSDSNTGVASAAADTVNIVTGGTSRLAIANASVTSTVPILVPDGSAGAPTFAFSGEATTGWYRASGGTVDLATTGTARFRFSAFDMVLGSTGTINWSSGAIGAANDVSITRESAAVIQLGVDAAGTTAYTLKGNDRITSDGVGGNLTIAGGRNRGASAGGSLIFQTSPAAGAGVTGTLTTALTIDSTQTGTWTQPTLGTAVEVLSTTATNDDPTETVRQYRATTTDGTPTALATITIATDYTTYISAWIVARRTGGTAGSANDGAAYRLDVVVKNTTGTVAEIAAETLTVVGESQAGWTVTAAASGATEVISVTGATDNNVVWHATVRTWAVST